MIDPLFPDLPGFSIEQVTIANGIIVVLACSQTSTSPCPECQEPSARIHSRYQRQLSDLP